MWKILPPVIKQLTGLKTFISHVKKKWLKHVNTKTGTAANTYSLLFTVILLFYLFNFSFFPPF